MCAQLLPVFSAVPLFKFLCSLTSLAEHTRRNKSDNANVYRKNVLPTALSRSVASAASMVVHCPGLDLSHLLELGRSQLQKYIIYFKCSVGYLRRKSWSPYIFLIELVQWTVKA